MSLQPAPENSFIVFDRKLHTLYVKQMAHLAQLVVCPGEFLLWNLQSVGDTDCFFLFFYVKKVMN